MSLLPGRSWDAGAMVGSFSSPTFTRMARLAMQRGKQALLCRRNLQVPSYQGEEAYYGGIDDIKERIAEIPSFKKRGEEKELRQGRGRRSAVILFYLNHDASVAVGIDGRVQCVLELERLFEERYYNSPGWRHSEEEQLLPFHTDWSNALHILQETCECEDGPCPSHFDYGVIVRTWEVEAATFVYLPIVVEGFFTVKQWQYMNHSEAHAQMGFFSSPFRSAVVFAIGNGANDGQFNVYLGRGLELQGPLARLDYNMGEVYNILGGLLEEVIEYRQDRVYKAFEKHQLGVAYPVHLLDFTDWQRYMSVPGKLMGYSALGEASHELLCDRGVHAGIPAPTLDAGTSAAACHRGCWLWVSATAA